MADVQEFLNEITTPISDLIAKLTKSSSAADIGAVIQRIAVEVPSESQAAEHVGEIARVTGRTKGPLAADLKLARKKAKEGNHAPPDMDRVKFYVEHYAHINVGGKHMIVDRRAPKEDSSLMPSVDFEKLHAKDRTDYLPEGSPKLKTIYWAKEFVTRPPEETTVYSKGFVFDPRPGATCNDRLNLYTGMKVEAKAGGSCKLLRRLILEVWCAGDEKLAAWVWEWLQHAVARPWERADTAIAVRGGFGAGKSIVFGKVLKKILGDLLLIVEKEDQVLGNFNGAMKGKIVVVMEEAAFGGNAALFDKLKHVITSDEITINDKHKSAYSVDNFARMVIISNHDQFLNIAPGDRRYTVLVTDDDAAQNWQRERLYEKMLDEWGNGGAEAFLHEALNHDFRTLENSKTLVLQKNFFTEALAEQVSQSRRGMDKAVADFLISGRIAYLDKSGEVVTVTWDDEHELEKPSVELREALVSLMSSREAEHRGSLKAMLAALARFGINGEDMGRRNNKTIRKYPPRLQALEKALKRRCITEDEYHAGCGGVTMDDVRQHCASVGVGALLH